jgi:hypothetical protein
VRRKIQSDDAYEALRVTYTGSNAAANALN